MFPVPSWVPSIIDSSTTSASSIASPSVTSLHEEGHYSGPFKRLRRWSLGTANKSPNRPARSGTFAIDDAEVLDLPSPAISPAVSPGAVSPGAPTSILRVGSQVSVQSMHSHHSGLSHHSNPRSYLGPTVDLLAQQDQELAIRQQIAKEDQKHHMVVQPKVRAWFAVGMLMFMTALAGVTAEWLVDSIDGLTATGNVSREFVGLILLPVIGKSFVEVLDLELTLSLGNSVEHITAVTVSVKDKLNLSMSIAVGSSIQVSLCILPILVLLGWAIGQPMMLYFDIFETIIIVIAVLLVNFAISDGRTNWLEGATLMLAYVSIALAAWFYDPVFEGT